MPKDREVTCKFSLDRYPYNRPRLEGLVTSCQFSSVKPELEVVGEHTWCVFHLPEEVKKQWREAEIERFNRLVAEYVKVASETKSFVDLSGVVFPGPVSNATLGTQRLPATLFIKSIFLGEVDFSGLIFSDIVHFDDCDFRDQALLYEIRYLGDAHFNDADFGPNIHLGDSEFSGHAYFQGAKFPSNAWCSNIKFLGRAWFQRAMFNGIAYFKECEFCGDADFSVTYGQATPDMAFGAITFEASRFRDRVSFTNREFRAGASFASVTFHVAPEFYGCKLHQDTSFAGTRFRDVGRAKRRTILNVAPREVDAPRAYRVLKLSMEAVRNRDDEARFFALEQRSLQHDRNVPVVVKLVSALYGVTSDYGRSIARPLLLLILNAAIVFGTTARRSVDNTGSFELTAIARSTLLQLVRPFELLSRGTFDDAVALAAVGHGLANIILLSLLIVAVRRQFKVA